MLLCIYMERDEKKKKKKMKKIVYEQAIKDI